MSAELGATPEPPPIPRCPICDGKTEIVYSRFSQVVAVCIDCQSGITIPASAWEIQRLKREGKWPLQ